MLNERTNEQEGFDLKKIQIIEQKVEDIEDALDEFAKQVCRNFYSCHHQI